MKIFLIGFMGSGKTTMGKRIAARMNYLFFDMDSLIEEDAGMSVNEIFNKLGEERFREMERDLLLKLVTMDNFVVSTGGGVPCYRDNMTIINKYGISVYLRMTAEALFSRLVKAKGERPLLKNLSPGELKIYIHKKLEEREPYYMKAHHVVDAMKVHPGHLIQLFKEY